MFTGLSHDGLNLLQNYIDVTGDVQSAVAICLQGYPHPDIVLNETVSHWIESYRLLLDQWGMWVERSVKRYLHYHTSFITPLFSILR